MDFSHRLSSAFIPKAVAVVGASDRIGSRGTFIWNGVMNSRLALQAYPVNPKYKYIGLTPCWAKLADLPTKVDLAVISVGSKRVMGILRECAELGIKNVLITPGQSEITGDRHWRSEIVEFAKKHSIRVIGPDSIGIMRPGIGLNVSYWPELPLAGRIGLICQSGSVTSSVLDHAANSGYGFSSVITAGKESDVTLAEIVDFMTTDPKTDVIAIHVESLRNPRTFFSAVRAAVRVKPVIILKAGTGPNANRCLSSSLAMPTGDDGVFDSMVGRSGAVRCTRLEEFCATLGVFSADRNPQSGKIAILANGLGFSSLAADATDAAGLQLADLSGATEAALSSLISSATPISSTVDVGTDAVAEKFAAVLDVLLAAPEADAVLVALAPTAVLDNPLTVRLINAAADKSYKPVIAVWAGQRISEAMMKEVRNSRTPWLTTFELSAQALSHLCACEKRRRLRLTAPEEGSEYVTPNLAGAREVIELAKSQGRHQLMEHEAAKLLEAFDVNCVASLHANTAEEAVEKAREIGFPVAMKLCASGVSHKTDVGGVMLDLYTARDVEKAFDAIRENCARLAPMAEFHGVHVQQMIKSANAREVRITVETDPALGPAIYFGAGGQTGEIFPETCRAILPLNGPQAMALVNSSRISQSLGQFRGMPEADKQSVVKALMRISRLVCEIPAIVELHVNPLMVDENGITAIDCEVSLCRRPAEPDEEYSHLAVCPNSIAHTLLTARAGMMRIRQIRADDFAAIKRLLARISPQSAYMRFHKKAEEVTDNEIIEFTSPDFDRHVAYVIEDNSSVGPEIHGVVRLNLPPQSTEGEFGILVEDAYQGNGFGRRLMDLIAEEAVKRGCTDVVGYVLKGNTGMASLMSRCGFVSEPCEGDESMITYRKICGR